MALDPTPKVTELKFADDPSVWKVSQDKIKCDIILRYAHRPHAAVLSAVPEDMRKYAAALLGSDSITMKVAGFVTTNLTDGHSKEWTFKEAMHNTALALSLDRGNMFLAMTKLTVECTYETWQESAKCRTLLRRIHDVLEETVEHFAVATKIRRQKAAADILEALRTQIATISKTDALLIHALNSLLRVSDLRQAVRNLLNNDKTLAASIRSVVHLDIRAHAFAIAVERLKSSGESLSSRFCASFELRDAVRYVGDGALRIAIAYFFVEGIVELLHSKRCSVQPPNEAVDGCIRTWLPRVSAEIEDIVKFAKRCQIGASEVGRLGVPFDAEFSDSCIECALRLIYGSGEEVDTDDAVVREALVASVSKELERVRQATDGIVDEDKEDVKLSDEGIAAEPCGLSRAQVLLLVAAVRRAALLRVRFELKDHFSSAPQFDVDLESILELKHTLKFFERFGEWTKQQLRHALRRHANDGGFRNPTCVLSLKQLGYRIWLKPCRYGAQCSRGIWCAFRHAGDRLEDIQDTKRRPEPSQCPERKQFPASMCAQFGVSSMAAQRSATMHSSAQFAHDSQRYERRPRRKPKSKRAFPKY